MAKNNSQSKERRERQAALDAQQKKKEKIVTWAFIAGGIAFVLGLTLAIILIVQNSITPAPDNGGGQAAAEEYIPKVPENATNYVSIKVSYTDDDGEEHTGDIVVELNPEAAPITVANFQNLVGSKFYDGLIFHRVIPSFMIQGGDPEGTGRGGSENNIKGEFSANGVDTGLKHERGVISMAREGNAYNDELYYNTASSQFFIVHETYPSLDGKYAAFGKVISGMEHVDGIAAMKTDSNDKPVNEAKIISATFIEKP